MKFSAFGLLASLAASAAAEDLLFVDKFQYVEYTEAVGPLGYTAKVVTEDEWRAMTTADFAAFKAIILSDPICGPDPSVLSFLDDTKATWSPAIQGNMVLIGTDPTYHSTYGVAGATTLIDNAVRFAASGETAGGATQTGLYFALSCYYNDVDTATVTVLSEFGDFGVRGDLSCYNVAHVVASSPALGTLDDAALSDWSCSVHEAFSRYPSVGVNGFQALAIAKDIIGEGSQTFGDGTIGLPYIISRGATPAGCGDGEWNADLGEECDDGNTVSGDGCSASCKCESGRPAGDGSCLPPIVSSSISTSSTPTPYRNVTITKTTTATDLKTVTATTTFHPPPYKTPTCPTGPKIIGVEIIIIITIVEECHTLRGSTVTTTITKAHSTHHRPIWNTDKPGYPCYVCALPSTTSPCFITATTTSILSATGTGTHAPPVIKTCATCSETTLDSCPPYTPLPTTATETVCEVPAPTLGTHIHQKTTASAGPLPTHTYSKGPVGTGAVPKPTVVFTAGAAGLVGAQGAVAAGLVGFAAVLAL